MNYQGPQKAEFLYLYTPVQPKLFSFILAIVHNRNDAEDLLQETSVLLWDKYEKYNKEMNFNAWATGIARNKVLEYLRRNRKTKMVFGDCFYEEMSSLAEQSSDDVSNRIEALDSCVKKLNSSDRKLLNLRFYHNKVVREISQQTGRPANSIYNSLARIILLLRDCVSRQLRPGVIYEG